MKNKNREKTDVIKKDFMVKPLDGEYTFEGYLSTYNNADRVGDIILPGAFDEALSSNTIKVLLFNHSPDEVIGKVTLSSDSKGLKAFGELNKEISKASEIYSLLKQGALTSMSIGMRILDYSPIDPENLWGAWEIIKADILEASIVAIPANTQATIDSVKSLGKDEPKDIIEEKIEDNIEDKIDLEKEKAFILNKINIIKEKYEY